MRKAVKYKTVLKQDATDFHIHCTKALSEGWELFGNPFGDDGFMIQAFVKYEDEDDFQDRISDILSEKLHTFVEACDAVIERITMPPTVEESKALEKTFEAMREAVEKEIRMHDAEDILRAGIKPKSLDEVLDEMEVELREKMPEFFDPKKAIQASVDELEIHEEDREFCELIENIDFCEHSKVVLAPTGYKSINTRIWHSCERAGITTLQELLRYNRSELLDLHGILHKCVDIIEDYLQHHGLALKSEDGHE